MADIFDKTETVTPEQTPVEQFKGRCPSDWSLVEHEDDPDTIVGTNYSTRETFEGTRAEFNARLRG